MEVLLAILAVIAVFLTHREGVRKGREEARGEDAESVAGEKRDARHSASLRDKLRGIYERFANRS